MRAAKSLDGAHVDVLQLPGSLVGHSYGRLQPPLGPPIWSLKTRASVAVEVCCLSSASKRTTECLVTLQDWTI